jgi:Rrf2 family protein
VRISQEADYAIRVVLYLSHLGYGEVVGAQTIAEHEAISLRFLLKLFRKLVKAGIIQSFRGVNGGYALARIPAQINLKEVIEAIDGPICMNRCIYDPAHCNKNSAARCEAHRALCAVNDVLVEKLASINFLNIMEQ